MSDYADNYNTDTNGVNWVKMDYVNPIMKKTELAIESLEKRVKELEQEVLMSGKHLKRVQAENETWQDAWSKKTESYKRLEERVTPIENGTNRYGVDISYFRKTINRELNHGLSDYKPDELARVLARLSVTADREVIKEPEFTKTDNRES